MAGKKDPSIYDDRSSLGSSDELDEYGVWVKNESQDLSSALPDMEEIPDITDAGDSDLPDFSDFSSSELGISDLPEDDLSMPELDTSDLPEDDFSMPELDASGLPEDDFGMSEPDISGLPEPDISGLPEDDFSMPELDTSGLPEDDFSMPEMDASGLPESGTSGLPEDDFSMPEPDISGLPEPDTSGLPEDNFSMPEMDASGLPESGTSGLPEPDTSGFLQNSSPESSSYDDDDDDIIGQNGPLGGPDLEFVELVDDSQLPSGSASEFSATNNTVAETPKESFAEVSMDDFMDTSSSSGSVPKSIDFGNLDAKLPDIEEPSSSGRGSNQGGIDLSNQLLMKIADELSSIKKELSSLKQEFSVVRGEVKEAKAEAAESKGGGFFDEEEDEKIALTGDELDNILHTANFTEESGSDEGLNDDLSIGDTSAPAEEAAADTMLSEKEDIISESGEELKVEDQLPEEIVSEEMPPEEPLSEETAVFDSGDISFDDTDIAELDGALKVEDEIKDAVDSFDSSLDIDASLPDFDDVGSDLNDLREMGVRPVTSPPEDTSYLEADPLASAPMEDQNEAIDFSGAAIDEPDLSLHITENPVSEPELDNIAIDIDMEEPEIPESPAPEDFVFETEDVMEIPTDRGIIGIEEPAVSEPAVFEPAVFEPPVYEPEISEPAVSAPVAKKSGPSARDTGLSSSLKEELKIVLSYMDQLLESLPEEKIEEFAKSEYFETYKKLFEELGLA